MLETFETVAKAVADPSRMRILKLLEGGELCVCQIVAVLDLAPATVSRHLALLKTAGLLQQRRSGKWAYYRIADKEFNDYAQRFLALARASLVEDPTVAGDRRTLARVNAVPLAVLCQHGRATLGRDDEAAEANACRGEPA